jgi:hypothetical protein
MNHPRTSRRLPLTLDPRPSTLDPRPLKHLQDKNESPTNKQTPSLDPRPSTLDPLNFRRIKMNHPRTSRRLPLTLESQLLKNSQDDDESPTKQTPSMFSRRFALAKKHYIAARLSGRGAVGYGSGGRAGSYSNAFTAAKHGLLIPETVGGGKNETSGQGEGKKEGVKGRFRPRDVKSEMNITTCVAKASAIDGGIFCAAGDYDLGRVWNDPCEVCVRSLTPIPKFEALLRVCTVWYGPGMACTVENATRTDFLERCPKLLTVNPRILNPES